MQRANLSVSRWTPITFLQKRSAHQLNLAHSGHWTWWWFNGSKQEKHVIKCLQNTLGKLKSINFLTAQCLALHPWALQAPPSSGICLDTPIVSAYDFVRYKAAGVKCSVLHFCPVWCFLEILGISIQMAFSELGQISSFSTGRTSFLEWKRYFLRKSLTCSWLLQNLKSGQEGRFVSVTLLFFKLMKIHLCFLLALLWHIRVLWPVVSRFHLHWSADSIFLQLLSAS